MSDYSNAIEYYVDRSRVFQGNNSCSAIVVHGTGGPETWTAQQLGDYFRTTSALTSSHFGIDRAGVICQYVRLWDGAAANCCLEAGHDPFWDQFGGDNLNIHTISIEHINDATNSLPLTDAQKAASFKLVAWLCAQYGLTSAQIKTHASIAPQSRANCPGPYPFDELMSYLQGESPMIFDQNSPLFAPFFQQVTNQNWLCTVTNKSITLGMLEYYKTLSFNPQTQLPCVGLPLTNERYARDNPPVSVLICERGALIYDPQHAIDNPPGSGAVYIAHMNDPLILKDPVMQKALTDEIDALETKIANAQKALA